MVTKVKGPLVEVDINGTTTGLGVYLNAIMCDDYADARALDYSQLPVGQHVQISGYESPWLVKSGTLPSDNGWYLLPDTPSGSKYLESTGIMKCVIRQDSAGSGWYFIDDSGHTPFGFSSVAISGVTPYELEIQHEGAISEIGGASSTCDEWYTKAGVRVGNSVGSTVTKLLAHKDASFTVSNSTQSVTANGFFGSTITAALNSDKTVTVTHPTALSGSDMPTATMWRPSSGNGQMPVIVSATSTTLTYAMYANLDGYVYHSGGSWQVDTNSYLKPTITADSTGITITHNGLQSGISLVTARDGWGGVALIDTNTSVSTKVVLRDYTGALIDPTVSSDSYSFYFTSTELVQQENLYGGVVINRANVALDWNNLYGSTGNIWVINASTKN